MEISDRYREAFARAKESASYWTESTLLDLAGKLLGRMKELGLKQSMLADKMGKKAPQINRVLSGRHNVTIQTLCEAAFAMDMKVEIRLEPIRKGEQQGLITSLNDAMLNGARPVTALRLIKAGGAGGAITSAANDPIRKVA